MTPTGIWTTQDEFKTHLFDYRLAQFIGRYFQKDIRVIDFGCGRGSYLKYLSDIGFQDVKGVEGSKDLDFEMEVKSGVDLATDYVNMGTGNVMSLEVGEHIPHEYFRHFMDTLVRHVKNPDPDKGYVNENGDPVHTPSGKLILSWAIPGQSGDGHVNCRPNVWVINEMNKRGMRFLGKETMDVRSVIEWGSRTEYFRESLMIFEK